MQVCKRDGSMEPVDKRKIVRCVERACRDLDVSVNLLVDEAYQQLFDGISTNDIDRALVLAARSRIVHEPDYSYVAARLLLHSLYKEVFGHGVDNRRLNTDYRNSFIVNINHLVSQGRLSKEFLSFDLIKLANALKPERDLQFKYLGLQTLYDRYFIHIDGRRMEAPQSFWMRVALGICLKEKDPIASAVELYDVYSQFYACPSTPTLFNSGAMIPQLSSCYLSTVGDSIDGIFGAIHDQARLSKFAGGLGTDWTPIRGLNAYIKGTNGKSQGVVPWLKIYNDTLLATNQGGKRKGAGCATLEVWHTDIFDFIDLRKNTGDDRRRTHDMNTAVWVPNLFMKRVREDGDWTLFSPDDCPELHSSFAEDFERLYEAYESKPIRNKKVIKAKELWRKILVSLLETGHPWVTFKDSSNARYQLQKLGVVNNLNLCTEISLHTIPQKWVSGELVDAGETAVCNLASVNLGKFVREGVIDQDLLRSIVRKVIRGLDNVIDQNYYPTAAAECSNKKHRPIGLGIMGWMDTLRQLNIEPDSDEAVKLAGETQERISYYAIEASCDLADEKGLFPSFEHSTWAEGKVPLDTYSEYASLMGKSPVVGTLDWDALRERVRKGVRNGHLMAIAPTATISFIVGCSQSIEPDHSVLFVYSTLSGEFTMVNEYFVKEVKSLGLWNEELVNQLVQNDGDVMYTDLPNAIKMKYRRAFDLDMHKLIDAAASRQVWIDMAQSLNIYSNKKSLKYLSDLYFHAWDSLLKSTYYLRSTGDSKVEKSVQSCSVDNPSCESCQ